MQLSSQAISDFQKIYQKHFGELLTDGEANKKGLDLLRLMKMIYRPIPKNSVKYNDDYKSHK